MAHKQIHRVTMLLAGGMVLNIASVDRIRTSYPPIAEVSLVYYTRSKLIAHTEHLSFFTTLVLSPQRFQILTTKWS